MLTVSVLLEMMVSAWQQMLGIVADNSPLRAISVITVGVLTAQTAVAESVSLLECWMR